jgi:UDP-N-acetylmuramate--L-alanine ligase/UDP-N-acetylenolpyruvoylglucosamine reductase
MKKALEQTLKIISERLAAHSGHVHLIGICGIGMAGLAFHLKNRGFNVSGCDSSPNQLADWLQKNGIAMTAGHGPEHVQAGVDWIIRSAAVSDDSPEIARAVEKGIFVCFRGEVLPQLLTNHKSVAVCGTHGKTTTATFIASVLKHSGRDPSWCIGGENEFLGGVAGAGQTPSIVVEADESDGTLALYRPDIAVVTNIEFDHMEHFDSVEDFENCFKTFIGNTRKKVIFCADDPRASTLCRSRPNARSYGFSRDAEVRGDDLSLSETSLRFVVFAGGRKRGIIDLPAPGRHNALNALAATAVCLERGLSFEEIREGLAHVTLPRRRFEKVAEACGVTVISDYAHHPSEVAALVRAATGMKRSRLLAVFQPHRFTRTLALGRDFPPAFDGIDQLVLVPVYAASEKPLKGGTIWDLYHHFREGTLLGRKSTSGTAPHTIVATSLEQAWAYFRRELKSGDKFLVVGAGDVEKIGGWAKTAAEKGGIKAPDAGIVKPVFDDGTVLRFEERLAGKTTMKVGGSADIWAEIGSERDLAKVLRWARESGLSFCVLGAGSNVVVSDLGVRGVVGRLTGADFSSIEEGKEGIAVGAGVPLAKLVDWMEARGYAGYEFLEGIPGTAGGALRMNAGAWGSEIGTQVLSATCVDMAGNVHVLKNGESSGLEFEYRNCKGLAGMVVVRLILAAGKAGPIDDIRKRRSEIREKRKWWKGLRCAGSVFKNPPGHHAGSLVERVGMKGAKVGGASVSKAHANVIVTEEGALASDVRCLVETIRAEVLKQSGVVLETEVVFLE